MTIPVTYSKFNKVADLVEFSKILGKDNTVWAIVIVKTKEIGGKTNVKEIFHNIIICNDVVS